MLFFCNETSYPLGHELDPQQEEVLDLQSLGINPRRKNELNDREELAGLADAIKQAMYDDYKTAYGKEGDSYEQEAWATVSP